MTSRASTYLLRDEFIDWRNRQEEELNTESRSIRDSVDEVKKELKEEIKEVKQELKQEIKELKEELKQDIKELKEELKELKEDVEEFKEDVKQFKEDVKQFKEDVKEQFANVDKQFSRLFDLSAESLRSIAYMRNSALENPNLPIQPLVTFDPNQNAILQPEYFPRNYNDFSSLRDPRTDRQRHMLIYLADFYEIPLQIGGSSSAEDSSNEGDGGRGDGDDEDEILLDSPVRVVEALETTLGLVADKFRAYKERAQAPASHPPRNPIKRSQISPSSGDPNPRRRKLEIRLATTGFSPIDQSEKPKSLSSEEKQAASRSWEANPRSTPTSEIYRRYTGCGR